MNLALGVFSRLKKTLVTLFLNLDFFTISAQTNLEINLECLTHTFKLFSPLNLFNALVENPL